MKYLEPYMQASADKDRFAGRLTAAADFAKTNPPADDEGPEFDTYGLTPLGRAVGDELAALVAESDTAHPGCRVEANRSVPEWATRGFAYFQGDFPTQFMGTVYDPFEELVTPLGEEVIFIASGCLMNGAAAVMDANLVLRSMIGYLDILGVDAERKVEVLRKSTRLVTRLAMINDTGNKSAMGRTEFMEATGVGDPREGAISPKHLSIDDVHDSVDLTIPMQEKARQCSIPGGGCPALRKLVMYKGAETPMIMAFWDASVSVVEARLDKVACESARTPS